MKKKRYNWGGFSSLKDNPYPQTPGGLEPLIPGMGIPAINSSNLVYPNNTQDQQRGSFTSKPTFDINYNYLAASNATKGVLGYLGNRRNQNEFNDYNRAQQNPLLQLPYTPNTSEQSRYGMEYSRKGGYKYQEGGPKQQGPTNRPTTADSLALYNNAKKVAAYYNNPSYVPSPTKYGYPAQIDHPERYNIVNDRTAKVFKEIPSAVTNTENGKIEKFPYEFYRKDLNENQYLQREIAHSIMDPNSPMTLFDRRIKPQQSIDYINIDPNSKLTGDIIGLYKYDPIAVKPWNMLTDNERKIRVKKYGYPQGYEAPNNTQNPNGQKKPIIVNDQNDPRLKAYNDSLDLNTLSSQGTNLTQGIYKNRQVNALTDKQKQEYQATIEPQLSSRFEQTKNKSIYNVPYPSDIQALIYNKNIAPTGYYDMGTRSLYSDNTPVAPFYKKPVQPYIYQKENPPRPLNSTEVSRVNNSNENINVQPIERTALPINQQNFTYNDIPPGPYNPNKGQVVYKGNQLVGYTDSNGTVVDPSYHDVIDPKKKRMGGLLYRDSKFVDGDGKCYYGIGGPTDPMGKPIQSTRTDPYYTLADQVNYGIANGQDPFRSPGTQGIGNAGIEGSRDLMTSMRIFNSRPDLQGMSPEQRITSFYDTQSNNPAVQSLKTKLKSLGQGPTTLYQDTPDVRTQEFRNALKFDDGGEFQQEPNQKPKPKPPVVAGTELNSLAEIRYQIWRSKLPKPLQYEGDYDLRGLWMNNPNVKPSSNMHFPDTYKLPNHPTFSNESQYFSPDTKNFAGHWNETDSSYNYIPYNPLIKDTIIEKKRMDDGGYVDFEDEFDKDLSTSAPEPEPVEQVSDDNIADQIDQQEGTPSKGFYENNNLDSPYESSAKRLSYLMDADDNSGIPLANEIGKIESNNNYAAFNPKGGGEGAVGKYQFRWNLHKSGIAALTGVKDKQEFLSNPYAQEKYFQSWDETVLTPAANNLLPYAQLKNPNATIDDVKKQIHFSGPAGAARFYKQGIITKDAMGTTNNTYGKYKIGGEVEVSDDELQDMIAKGFKFDII